MSTAARLMRAAATAPGSPAASATRSSSSCAARLPARSPCSRRAMPRAPRASASGAGAFSERAASSASRASCSASAQRCPSMAPLARIARTRASSAEVADSVAACRLGFDRGGRAFASSPQPLEVDGLVEEALGQPAEVAEVPAHVGVSAVERDGLLELAEVRQDGGAGRDGARHPDAVARRATDRLLLLDAAPARRRVSPSWRSSWAWLPSLACRPWLSPTERQSRSSSRNSGRAPARSPRSRRTIARFPTAACSASEASFALLDGRWPRPASRSAPSRSPCSHSADPRLTSAARQSPRSSDAGVRRRGTGAARCPRRVAGVGEQPGHRPRLARDRR